MAFDAVIPAYVRYSKECCMGAKMLYGEIRALSYAEGYCWAGDEHLGKLYDVSERTIRTWLMELKQAGFIAVESGKNQHGQRRLTLSEMTRKKTSKAGRKLPSTLEENFQAEGGVYKDEELDVLNIPLNPQNSKKEKTYDKPTRSIAIILEDLEQIPADLWAKAGSHNITDIANEWAKFRNHHISARSKHTRVDLCWDNWCRNAAKWQRGSGAASTGARAGSGSGHDIVASASRKALAGLYGERTAQDYGRTYGADSEACPFGSRNEASKAVLVDVSADATASFQPAIGTAGGSADSDAGTAFQEANQ